jgi:hypothetical protein
MRAAIDPIQRLGAAAPLPAALVGLVMRAALAGTLLLGACATSPTGPGAPASPAPAPASATASSPAGKAGASGTAAAPAKPAVAVNGAAPTAAAPADLATPVREAAVAEANGSDADAAAIDAAARAFYVYFDRVRQMSPGELGREFARLDQPATPAAALELALALGQTRNPNDTVRALGVLDPLVRSADPQIAPWRPLARLLAARYAEQRRLEEQIERQAQQLRDAQRRQEQLAQQLEALKAIERSLTNRLAAPPPAGANNRPAAP